MRLCSVEGDTQQLRAGLTVFEPLGYHPEGESLDSRERGLRRVAIREDTGQLEDFGQPTAVVLLLSFNLERNRGLNQYTT
jgi:hypothetical protein